MIHRTKTCCRQEVECWTLAGYNLFEVSVRSWGRRQINWEPRTNGNWSQTFIYRSRRSFDFSISRWLGCCQQVKLWLYTSQTAFLNRTKKQLRRVAACVSSELCRVNDVLVSLRRILSGLRCARPSVRWSAKLTIVLTVISCFTVMPSTVSALASASL